MGTLTRQTFCLRPNIAALSCGAHQLNTLEGHTVCAPTPVPVQAQVQSTGWESCMCNRFQWPLPWRQPHSHLRADWISLSGEWGLLCQELTTAEDNPHTTRHGHFLLQPQCSCYLQQVIVAFDQGRSRSPPDASNDGVDSLWLGHKAGKKSSAFHKHQ